jgi:hypothetical protein
MAAHVPLGGLWHCPKCRNPPALQSPLQTAIGEKPFPDAVAA